LRDRNNRCDKHLLNQFSRVLHVRLNDHKIPDADRVNRNKRNLQRQRLNHVQQIREEDKVRCSNNRSNNLHLNLPRPNLREAAKVKERSLNR
jgi:hypothetical protein